MSATRHDGDDGHRRVYTQACSRDPPACMVGGENRIEMRQGPPCFGGTILPHRRAPLHCLQALNRFLKTAVDVGKGLLTVLVEFVIFFPTKSNNKAYHCSY